MFDLWRGLPVVKVSDVGPPGAAEGRFFPGGFLGMRKTDRRGTRAPVNVFLEPNERPAADEQDVGGIHRSKLLMWMLSAALRRNISHRAFQNLQQRLLDSLARDVARDRRDFVLAADFVDLVYIDDPLLAALHVPI